uniref:PDEase domain-containing protein n=1 Tax=Chromera velia CCMP2878 TaxID=1169474 RepID=A0A0G4HJ71_9ALVE|eukprot:Cvel_7055.t1-p1 / transcript=Cvel_7055.t1 / gene=Cvel_7055 / organism=Chromera_velia_CCMP2878 / gene_product=hypothetical protein / transcript_product=hypothetical protein / location=Cvel_scaffold360:73322-80967(-) / protein_length=752 / sequence_SO=supercontig / SO=protein_coding / is_pseudo=false
MSPSLVLFQIAFALCIHKGTKHLSRKNIFWAHLFSGAVLHCVGAFRRLTDLDFRVVGDPPHLSLLIATSDPVTFLLTLIVPLFCDPTVFGPSGTCALVASCFATMVFAQEVLLQCGVGPSGTESFTLVAISRLYYMVFVMGGVSLTLSHQMKPHPSFQSASSLSSTSVSSSKSNEGDDGGIKNPLRSQNAMDKMFVDSGREPVVVTEVEQVLQAVHSLSERRSGDTEVCAVLRQVEGLLAKGPSHLYDLHLGSTKRRSSIPSDLLASLGALEEPFFLSPQRKERGDKQTGGTKKEGRITTRRAQSELLEMPSKDDDNLLHELPTLRVASPLKDALPFPQLFLPSASPDIPPIFPPDFAMGSSQSLQPADDEEEEHFCHSEAFLDFGLDERELCEFASRVEGRYRNDIPFHTATHGAEVMNAMEFLLQVRRSVLENFHAALCFRLLMLPGEGGSTPERKINEGNRVKEEEEEEEEGQEFHEKIDDGTWLRFRSLVIALILETDMKKHFESLGIFNTTMRITQAGSLERLRQMKDRFASGEALQQSASGCQTEQETGAEGRREKWGTQEDWQNEGGQTALQRGVMLKAFMKTSDICHAGKPFYLHEKWSLRICEEFHLQVGFVSFVALPLYAALSNALRSREYDQKLLGRGFENLDEWLQRCQNEITPSTRNKVSEMRRADLEARMRTAFSAENEERENTDSDFGQRTETLSPALTVSSKLASPLLQRAGPHVQKRRASVGETEGLTERFRTYA